MFVEFPNEYRCMFRYRITEYAPFQIYSHGLTTIFECPSIYYPCYGHSLWPLEFLDIETVCAALAIYASNRSLYASRYREAKFWLPYRMRNVPQDRLEKALRSSRR